MIISMMTDEFNIIMYNKLYILSYNETERKFTNLYGCK